MDNQEEKQCGSRSSIFDYGDSNDRVDAESLSRLLDVILEVELEETDIEI